MSDSDNTLEPLDRGIPQVNGNRSNPYVRGAVVLSVLALTGAALAVGWWQLTPSTEDDQERPREMTRASTVPERTFPTLQEPEPVEPPARLASAKPVVPIIPAVQPEPIQPREAPKPPPPKLDKGRSSLMSSGGRTDDSSQSATPVAAGSSEAGTGPMSVSDAFGRRGGSGGDLSDRLTPTKLEATSAGLLPSQQMMLAQGAYIPCSLRSRLDSTVTGLTSCTVSKDVYSDNGDVLLVDRGSVISGEYRSNIRQGQRRIFVLWSRIKTPNGVLIDLDSPATGSLGQTGVGGKVDTHFWQRFGGALLLSLVDDVAREVTSNNNNSDGNDATAIVIGSTTDTASSLAAEVLRNTINIPPTLYAHHGAEVGVYVARDLDFSGVYDLAVAQ